jgi:hypothetical protein
MARIGKNSYFTPIISTRHGSTNITRESGKLYLGIRDGKVDRYGRPFNPEYYRDNIGSFSVDIIVWEGEYYVQIVDFLEKMKEQNPNNQAIADACDDAITQKVIYLASQETSKEIKETKKEIQRLKEEDELEAYDAMTYKEMDLASAEESKKIEETGKKKPELKQESGKGKEQPVPPPPVRPSTVDGKKQERIAQLETKLTKLTETLAQLEEMQEKFEEERKRTDLLTKELEEKEEREKQLISQLEHAEKDPPVIVVAAPKDGVEVEVGTITFSGVAEDDEGLKGLDIFVNDNPLLAKAGRDIKVVGIKPPKRLEFVERILLQKGKNEIRIRATDTDGLNTEKILTVRYREVRKNVWAVVIGIDEYPKTRNLKYAVNDARAFYEHLIYNNRIALG